MAQKQKKIIHLRDKCIGCGMCSYLSPNYFEMSDEDGLAHLNNGKKVKNNYQANVIFGDEDQIEGTAKGCPVKIIKIV